MLAITALTTWQSAWDVLFRVAAIGITSFLLFDILFAHLTIVFVSQKPANSLRSGVLGLWSFFQIALGFAVFLLSAASAFKPPMTWHSAIYFSVLNATTLGHADLSGSHELLGEALIVIEVFVGLTFISVLIARLIGLNRKE